MGEVIRRSGRNVMRAPPFLLGLALLLVFTAYRGPARADDAPPPPPRLLIYLNGYLDGTRRASTWDERLVGERIDRAIAECKLKPEAPLLRIFGDAWAR